MAADREGWRTGGNVKCYIWSDFWGETLIMAATSVEDARDMALRIRTEWESAHPGWLLGDSEEPLHRMREDKLMEEPRAIDLGTPGVVFYSPPE